MFKTRRKLLSQNFLRDRELVKRLVRASGVLWDDMVLEIGAGNGIITENLLAVAKKVVAYEIDRTVFASTFDRLGKNGALLFICGDFLDFDLPREPYKVFSNIPFSRTGEIVKKLLFADNPPLTCDLIVQKEAADKFMVKKNNNSMLAILFYPWFDIKTIHMFKRTDFIPVPGVDSCLLRITKRAVPLVSFQYTDRYRDCVVNKYTKSKQVKKWLPEKWLQSYLNNTHCRDSFAKWQADEKRLLKIHRTRTDRNWKKY